MKNIEAVIFDMDGVIVDSEPVHERCFFEVLEELGYGQNHGMRFADYVGRSDFVLWQDFVRKNQPAESLEQLLEMKRNRVIDTMRREEPVFEGLLSLAQELAVHFRLGVASGSERMVIDTVMDLQGLRNLFSTCVSSGEVEHGKPAPDVFLRTAELLEVAPEKCVVIEDSKPGIAASLAAGMQVIAITNTYPAAELSRATHVVKSYDEIKSLLLKSVF